ncbi:PadR family transcriptional regulator [Streptomyces iakyrus]|uniref:PadR family transcriptional regulator n=1 Tax=Streptomyces iakyrus TaxID=68219 RepID=A0ABW8FGG0_9ACTN
MRLPERYGFGVLDIRLNVVLDTCSTWSMTNIRLTKPTMAVLETLLSAAEDAPAWGLSICRDADLGPGTVYPILDRLSQRGWVTSYEEPGPHPGRPARRFYELTGTGRQQAAQALAARKARRFGLGLSGGAA